MLLRLGGEEGGQGRAKLARRGSLDGPVKDGDTIDQEPRHGFLPACRPGVARSRGMIIESKGGAFLVGGVDQEFSQQSRQEAGRQSEETSVPVIPPWRVATCCDPAAAGWAQALTRLARGEPCR